MSDDDITMKKVVGAGEAVAMFLAHIARDAGLTNGEAVTAVAYAYRTLLRAMNADMPMALAGMRAMLGVKTEPPVAPLALAIERSVLECVRAAGFTRCQIAIHVAELPEGGVDVDIVAMAGRAKTDLN